jgi:hypothetical protein
MDFTAGDRVRCVNAEDSDPQKYAAEAARSARLAVETIFGELWARDPDQLQPFLEGMFERAMIEAVKAERIRARSARARKPRFKPGDRVKVIRGFGTLRKDDVYTVFSVTDAGLLRLEGYHLHGPFVPSRFAAVEPERMVSSPSRPRVVGVRINPGDTVVCLDSGCTLVKGRHYVVERVRRRRHNPRQQDDKIWVVGEGDNYGHWAYHFGLVKQAELDLEIVEPAGLDQYGPSTSPELPPHPVFQAVQRRFPTHCADIARLLDELKEG